MHCKKQINYALEELYRKRVSEVNKNKLILKNVKIKNEYYINLILSTLNHNKNFDDDRLVKCVLLQLTKQVTNINVML